MKSIKKFEEYELDVDGGEIAEEYVKLIISEFIDKKNDETLESVYADVIRDDQLDDEQEYIIKNELQDYAYTLFEQSKNIRKLIEIDSKKYNI